MKNMMYSGPEKIIVEPCGGEAYFDYNSMSYFCTTCFSYVGSVGCSCSPNIKIFQLLKEKI